MALWDSGCWRRGFLREENCRRRCDFGEVHSCRKESKWVAKAVGQRQVMQVLSREDERSGGGLYGRGEMVLGKWGWEQVATASRKQQ